MTKSRTLANCGRATRSDVVEVHVVGQGEERRATVSGLVTCSSVWACPVCSAHIRQARADDIEEGARRHIAAGGGLLMLTLTLRHHHGQALEDLLDGVLDGWRRTITGSPWKRRRQRHGIAGVVRAVEITHGGNGWHPHVHALIFTDTPLGEDDRDDLDGWLHARWSRIIKAKGLGTPSREHGVRLQVVRGHEIGRYVVKVQDNYGEDRGLGLELARGDLKAGRRPGQLLPFELLVLAAEGESFALRLWWEYEATTRGRQAITWSRGLRDRLGLGVEASDQEITAESEISEETLVAIVSASDWRAICTAGLDGAILNAAEDHGFEGVQAIITRARDGP